MRGLAVSIGVVILAGTGHAAAQPARPSFDEIDTDQSSTLTPDEVRIMLERGPTENADATRGRGQSAELVFERWDVDGDGAVTREEYDARPRQDHGGPPEHDDGYAPRRPPLVF